jgi:hypothetical protein
MAEFEALSGHLSGGTEDKREKTQSVSLPRLGCDQASPDQTSRYTAHSRQLAVWQGTWLVFWTFCAVLQVSKRFVNWTRSRLHYQFVMERRGHFIQRLEVILMLISE